MKSKWLPAEDELLVRMNKMKRPTQELANRFGATCQEVLERILALREAALEESKPPQDTILTDEQAKDVIKVLNELKASFLNCAQQYEKLGTALVNCSEVVSRCLEEDELAAALKEAFKEPRYPDDTIESKLARHLHKRYIIIANAPTEPDGN